MDTSGLVRELAGLKVDTGYTFENGAPFREPLGSERAEAMLHMLQDCGCIPLQPNSQQAPAIGRKENAPTH